MKKQEMAMSMYMAHMMGRMFLTSEGLNIVLKALGDSGVSQEKVVELAVGKRGEKQSA